MERKNIVKERSFREAFFIQDYANGKFVCSDLYLKVQKFSLLWKDLVKVNADIYLVKKNENVRELLPSDLCNKLKMTSDSFLEMHNFIEEIHKTEALDQLFDNLDDVYHCELTRKVKYSYGEWEKVCHLLIKMHIVPEKK